MLFALALPLGSYADEFYFNEDELLVEENSDLWLDEYVEESVEEIWQNENEVTEDVLFIEEPEQIYEETGFEDEVIIGEDSSDNTENQDNALFLTESVTFEGSGPVLEITSQPEDASGALGETVQFSVTASGTDLSYQWEWKSASTNWKATTVSGCTTDTITVEVTEKRNGYQYRCVVTDKNGNIATSEAATLTIASGPAITSQPEDASGALGETVQFSVTASGTDLSYQWEWKSASTNWKATTVSGCTTDTITVEVTEKRNGYQYRCVVTDKNGNIATSEAATLTVASDFVFSVQNNSATLIKYNGTDADVTVPKTYSNVPVTAIGPSAFEGNTSLESITLPNEVTIIGQAAFKNCSNLCKMLCY